MSEQELLEVEAQIDTPSGREAASATVQVEGLCRLIGNILALAMPNTLTMLSWTLQGTTGLYFVGRLNDVKALDAYALALSWSGIFGFSVLLGLACGFDTLGSQSYGRKDFAACGQTLNRAFCVVSVALLPCLMMMYLSGPIFNLVGLETELAEHAQRCALSFIPAIIIYIPQVLFERFLLAQRISRPQSIIQGCNTLLYPIYCYLFISVLDLSYVGAALSRAFSELVYTSGLALYILFSGACDDTLVKPSWDALTGWGGYLAIAFPTMMMICLEWWAYALTSIFVGKLGVAQLGAHTVAINLAGLIFLGCLGTGLATGTLVGNSIGEKNIRKGKIYTALGTVLTTLIIVGLGGICLIFRRSLARMFTSNPEVVGILDNLIILLLLCEIFDGMQGTLSKTLIGMGRQRYASVIILVTYYALMVPLAITLGFACDLKVYGVWTSFIIACIVVTTAFAIVIFRTDWDLLVGESEARTRATTEK